MRVLAASITAALLCAPALVPAPDPGVRIAGSAVGPAALVAQEDTTPPDPWPASAGLPDPDRLRDLRYRYVGPIGNRFSAVGGEPGNPLVYYAGAASGGVFKTEDGGVHWRPIFDDQPVQSIGAIAVAPSDPAVVWVGTGEPFIRSNVSHGNGVFRSTDAGETWERAGLEESGRIGRVVVHPDDPDVAWVAALGHLYGPQEERGVFRTDDGGETWERVLFVDQETGAVDLAMHPANPRILYAATWQMHIRTWGRWSGGPGSGIWKSTDGGDHWERLEGDGLPEPPLGKIGLAVSADAPDRLYALIETNSNRAYRPPEGCPVEGSPPSTVPACTGGELEHPGVLWRSDDAGRSWSMVNADHTLAQRPLYYTRMVAAPDDADELHFLSTRYSVSTNGGRDFHLGPGHAGGDHHDMWIDPRMPDRMMLGHDQGISISIDGGRNWRRPPLPAAQMYHVFTDDRVPYFLYGNRQDGPSFRGPSNTLTRGGIPTTAWHSVGGCESGFAVPDTVSDDVVWSGCYDGILERYRISTGHARNVSVWPSNPEGWTAGALRDRFQWTFPIHISPHDHERVYVGSQRVHVTTDGGQSWEAMSPDLTTDRDSLQRKTGGLTPDDSSPTYAAVLFAIAESPVEEGVIWAGSNDGLLHVTTDGGGSWREVSNGMPGLPSLSTMSNVEPSRHEAGKAYVAVDAHQLGDFAPYVYRTDDYGESWTRIDDGVPRSPISWSHVVREDPVRPGLLYLGTEDGLYVSFDDGARWISLQSNLPHAPVHWLDVQPRFGDLVVSTYGRGFWILDDVTPLQSMTPEVVGADAHLFRPRPAYRFQTREAAVGLPDDPAVGRNPEYGASLHVWVGGGAEVDADVEIVDDGGTVLRSLYGLRFRPGLNRFHWDLREEGSRIPRLRTEPLEHSHLEMPDRGWRALDEGGPVRPLAPPGRYTVRVRAGGETLTALLEVLKDPSSEGSEETIAEQVEMVRALRADVDRVAGLIESSEWLRSRLQGVDALLGEWGGLEGLRADVDSLEASVAELEMNLFDLRLTGGTAGQDRLRWPRKLYARLVSLAGYVAGTDHRPTDQAREVHRVLRERLARYEEAFSTIVEEDVTALDRSLRERGIEAVGGVPGG